MVFFCWVWIHSNLMGKWGLQNLNNASRHMSETVTLALIPCYLIHPPPRLLLAILELFWNMPCILTFHLHLYAILLCSPKSCIPFYFCAEELSTTPLLHLSSVWGSCSPGFLLEWTVKLSLLLQYQTGNQENLTERWWRGKAWDDGFSGSKGRDKQRIQRAGQEM